MTRLLGVILGLCALGPAVAGAQATMRVRYDAAEAAGPGGDGSWYRDATNEDGLLAWGTSYVMMSHLVMFEATSDLHYLRRLTHVADGVLAQRDSARGVTDFRGDSSGCWQSARYSAGMPYCWAVHTGMIAYPMAELAALVARRPELAVAETWDGSTLGDAAGTYLAAAMEAAASHDADWRDDGADRGYYVFPSDATFTSPAGGPMPLNMMNAMGRLHAAIADATGDATHLDRVRRLAGYFLAQTTITAAGGYAWSYRPGTYSAPGEDISHAAINVGFAARARRSGVVVSGTHLARLAVTAFDQVYVDTATTYDHVGGSGVTNGSGYRGQFGRWLVLDGQDERLHAAVRDTLAEWGTTTSGSLLLGFALLAATDRPLIAHRFYVADWADLGDRRRATAYGANILIRPPDPAARHLVPIRYRTSRRTEVQQWDGDAYHTVAKLAPTGAEGAVAHVPYDPALYFDYADGALYQFHDAFVAGGGIEIWNSETGEPPVITTTPGTTAVAGTTYRYEPAATGGAPIVWTADLPDPSPAMSFDAATGRIEWAPTDTGSRAFILRAHDDWGAAEQRWTVEVTRPPSADGGGTPGDGSVPTADAGPGRDAAVGGPGISDGGCGCGVAGLRSPAPIAPMLAGVVALALRRRYRDRPGRLHAVRG